MTNNFYNDLTIVIVAYNSNELLIECVDNVKEFKVIIVVVVVVVEVFVVARRH